MKTCTNCGRVHSPHIDICDRCGNMGFIPYTSEPKVTIGDIVKEKQEEKKVIKSIVEEVKPVVEKPIEKPIVAEKTSEHKKKKYTAK